MGANIVAKHLPYGTQHDVITDYDGYYRIPKMRVGRPYEIVINYVYFYDFIDNKVYLQLGDSKKMNQQLKATESGLEEVAITTSRFGKFRICTRF